MAIAASDTMNEAVMALISLQALIRHQYQRRRRTAPVPAPVTRSSFHAPAIDSMWRVTQADAMVSATVFFLIAALIGHKGYRHGAVHAGPYVLTLIGFAAMTVGGWLGGTIVFVYGMRVLGIPDAPPLEAVKPAEPDQRKAA